MRNGIITKSISAIFTDGQIKRLQRPSSSRLHWSADDIANGIAIHSAGPRAYRLLLRKKYPLPAVSTLKKWCGKVCISPGLILPVFKVMEMMKLEPLKKLCVLSFDEMKIKKQFLYNKLTDETLKPASYVQIAMVRGLFENWKQAVFFYFDCSMKKEKLETIISKVTFNLKMYTYIHT